MGGRCVCFDRKAAVAAAVGVASLALGAGVAGAKPMFQMVPHRFVQQPTTEQCETAFGIACYDATQLRHAYGADWLNARGVTGRGHTIVIVDSFGSPTIQSDLTTYDEENNLPAPPSLRIVTPAGAIPPWDPTGGERRHRLGRRDDTRCGGVPLDRSGREHPAGGDPGRGDRGGHRVPADDLGGELGHQPRPR